MHYSRVARRASWGTKAMGRAMGRPSTVSQQDARKREWVCVDLFPMSFHQRAGDAPLPLSPSPQVPHRSHTGFDRLHADHFPTISFAICNPRDHLHFPLPPFSLHQNTDPSPSNKYGVRFTAPDYRSQKAPKATSKGKSTRSIRYCANVQAICKG